MQSDRRRVGELTKEGCIVLLCGAAASLMSADIVCEYKN
jgi:hypothetical protein